MNYKRFVHGEKEIKGKVFHRGNGIEEEERGREKKSSLDLGLMTNGNLTSLVIKGIWCSCYAKHKGIWCVSETTRVSSAFHETSGVPGEKLYFVLLMYCINRGVVI